MEGCCCFCSVFLSLSLSVSLSLSLALSLSAGLSVSLSLALFIPSQVPKYSTLHYCVRCMAMSKVTEPFATEALYGIVSLPSAWDFFCYGGLTPRLVGGKGYLLGVSFKFLTPALLLRNTRPCPWRLCLLCYGSAGPGHGKLDYSLSVCSPRNSQVRA